MPSNPYAGISIPSQRPTEGVCLVPLPINKEWIEVLTGLCEIMRQDGYFEDTDGQEEFLAESISDLQYLLIGGLQDVSPLSDDTGAILMDDTGDYLYE